MTEYLITTLPPGITRAKIVQFFNSIEHLFFVSSKVDEITGFMHDFEASKAVCSNQKFPLETKKTPAEHGIIIGPLVSRQDIGSQSMCSGPNPFVIQRASNLFRPVGGSAVGCTSSLLQREPRALNAVDILRETVSGDTPSIMYSSGIPNALDYVVKKEEEPEDTNPLSSQDPPRPQPTQSLFFSGTHAEALMEEDATVATERLVKEEVDDEQFDDPEDREEENGGKTKEAHQIASTADLTLNGLQDGCRFECFVCNAVFSSHPLFLGHIRDHPEDKVRYRRRRSYVKSDPVQCGICGKSLTTKMGLKDHFRIHTGEKPYECEVCRKRFTHRTSRNSHIRMHARQKTHECRVCLKIFNQSSDLRMHFRTHTGVECTECQKRFLDVSILKDHRRHCHGSEKPSG